MRGFDYKSVSIPKTLVNAQSFVNKRDAIQGFNRVGRFGDKCSREKFNDVEIIDKK
jgi:glutaredoxin-related protein